MATLTGIPEELKSKYSSVNKKIPKFLRYEALQQLNIMFFWMYFLIPFFIVIPILELARIPIFAVVPWILGIIGAILAVYIIYVVQKNVKLIP
jgi:hypothetical protein